MPRIPVYEQRASYAVPAVQAPQVKRPVLKQADSRWDKISLWGQGVALAAQVPFIKKRLDRIGARIAEWWNNLFPQQPGANQRSANAENTAALEPSHAQGNPFRAQMLAGIKNAQDPLGELDAFAAETWNGVFGGGGENSAAARAFTDDYAVLRRDLDAARRSQQQDAARETWRSEMNQSVQMASLIRTPKGLESYLQDAQARVRQDADALGLDGEQAARDMAREAVAQNVASALAAGDVSAARGVYRAFETRLPEASRGALERKLQESAARGYGLSVWNTVQKGKGSGGAWKQALSEIPAPYRKNAEKYARLYARQEERARAGLRAQDYRALLHTDGDFEAARRALAAQRTDAEDFTRRTRALNAWEEDPGRRTEKAVFNGLYAALHEGKGDESDADKAFDAGRINARDYLLLKEKFAARAAGETEPDAGLLLGAARRWCQKRGLDEASAQAVLYSLNSSSGTAEEKSDRFRRMKEIWTD